MNTLATIAPAGAAMHRPIPGRTGGAIGAGAVHPWRRAIGAMPLERSAPMPLGHAGAASPPGDGEETRLEQARASARQLVSTAFIQPILEQARSNSMAAGPFAAGSAERRFGPMLDRILAEAATEASSFPLVDAVTERFAGPRARPDPLRAGPIPLAAGDPWRGASPLSIRAGEQSPIAATMLSRPARPTRSEARS